MILESKFEFTENHERVYACLVSADTPVIIESIAKQFGCLRLTASGNIAGSCGALLDRIANGSIRLVDVSQDGIDV